MNSFEDFNGSVDIDPQPVEKNTEGSIVSSPYEQALNDKNDLGGRILDLRKKIEEAPDLADKEELVRLQNELAVAERDYEEAEESLIIEERKMQAANRARHEEIVGARKKDADWDKAIGINNNIDRMTDWKNALSEDSEFVRDEAIQVNDTLDEHKKNIDWDEANRVNNNIDRVTQKTEALAMGAQFVRDEAIKTNDELDAREEDRDRDEETYRDNVAGVGRSLAFYARDPQRIEKQRTLVESLQSLSPEELKLEEAKYQEQLKGFEKDGVAYTDPKVQEVVKAWHSMQDRLKTESDILANMEKIFPARDADAQKFVERYWGGSLEEHEVARMEFEAEVEKMDTIEGLLNVISDWGAIPEGGKFLTNTKFREDLDHIFAISDENEKIRELEKITKNDEVCEKLLELYRKEYEALTPVEEDRVEKRNPEVIVSLKGTPMRSSPKASPRQREPLAARQRNIESPRKISPEEHALHQEFMKVRLEEKELEDLSEMVATGRFKWFPTSFLGSHLGRKYLRKLDELNIPMGTRQEREGAAVIALALRFQEVKDRRQALERRLGLGPSTGLRNKDLGGTAVLDHPREQARTKAQKRPNALSRFISWIS